MYLISSAGPRSRAACSALALSILALSTSLVFTGCDDEPASAIQVSLDSARAKWMTENPTGYRFVSVRSCECLPEVGMPIVVDVEGDTIVSATYEASGDPVSAEVMGMLYTIDGLFDVIQGGIDSGAYSVAVRYDPTYGHPLDIVIDYDVNIADEEFFLTVRDFTLTP